MYIGQTYLINFSNGGLTPLKNESILKPTQMIECRNFDLQGNTRMVRGGTKLINKEPVSDSPRIMNMFDFTTYIVFATSNGYFYKGVNQAIGSNLGTSKPTSIEKFGNKIFICNGNVAPYYWDGGAGNIVAMPSIPSSWAPGNYPGQFIAHGKGNSLRLWAVDFATTPFNVFASKNGDPFSFGDEDCVVLVINTGDLYGIVAGVVFQDNLILFGRRKAYIVDDSATNPAYWGYFESPWEGGTISWRTLVKTPNDIISMTEDFDIYSVSAASQYGDYQTASLLQGTGLKEWMRENLEESYITQFHGIYDPILRAVRFFVVRKDKQEIDTCLLYFIDRPLTEAWVIHDASELSASGYNASCSALIYAGSGDFHIWTGDYDGSFWKLNDDDKQDGSSGFESTFTSPSSPLEAPRSMKRFDKLYFDIEVFSSIQGEIKITPIIDRVQYGAFTIVATEGRKFYEIPLGYLGYELKFKVSSNVSGFNYAVHQAMVDFKPLTNKPQLEQ